MTTNRDRYLGVVATNWREISHGGRAMFRTGFFAFWWRYLSEVSKCAVNKVDRVTHF